MYIFEVTLTKLHKLDILGNLYLRLCQKSELVIHCVSPLTFVNLQQIETKLSFGLEKVILSKHDHLYLNCKKHILLTDRRTLVHSS